MEDVFPPEVWCEIPGTEGLYSVTSTGLVRRNVTRSGRVVNRLLKPYTNSRTGYQTVMISVRGRVKRMYVHRLVAMAFIGMPAPGQVVNHLNNNPADNRVENLEWTTQRGNVSHAIAHGHWHTTHPDRRGERSGRARLTREQVLEIRRLAGTLSCQQIAARYGISVSNARHIVLRESWAHLPEED